ncbi:MAG: ATP-binding cassette domain-containing protein, partial [Bacteroidetes bacterium]|nr:ATP-binding cassette domain-containing protein [Bacteroidota bacterium]
MRNREPVLLTNELEIGFTVSKYRKDSVYSGINISAANGELVALIGQNGIGKSTLLRTLANLQKALSGEILIKDTEISEYKRIEIARIISFVSTEPVRIANLKVFELVALGRFPHTNWAGRLKQGDRKVVQEAIRLVGLEGFEQKPVSEISDGERQRAMIARTLAQETGIVILDEPTAFLDLPGKYEIIQILNDLASNTGKTIIFSTHDLNIALHQADKIWLMLPGEIVAGAPEDLVLKPRFVTDNLDVLAKLAARTGRCAAVVGFVDLDRDLYNAAAVCAHGEVVGQYHKRLLPNTAVFDEARYFTPGYDSDPLELFVIGGVKVGISICEDIWSPFGPVAEQAAAGAELSININGSPFRAGKGADRER